MSSSNQSEPRSVGAVRWELARQLARSADRPARDLLEMLLSRIAMMLASASMKRTTDPDDPRSPQEEVDAAFIACAVLDVLGGYDLTLVERPDM